jgi:hypothetical protein
MFVGLVVCVFPRVLCRTSLEAMGQAGSPSKWAASFYSTRDLAGEYSCLHYIFSLERKTTYRNLQRGDTFPCDFFCFFFLTSPISIVFFLPCSVKESFVRELQSLRFLREWEWAETSSAIVCPCSRSEAHRNLPFFVSVDRFFVLGT